MTNIYGFESTDEVKYDAQGLPVGTYKAMIIAEDPDAKGRVVVVEFEAVSGENKGKRGKVWFLTLYGEKAIANGATGEDLEKAVRTGNIAQQNLKRIADATGKAVSATSPLKNRVMTITVAPQKNDPDRTEIKRYAPENAAVTEEIPY